MNEEGSLFDVPPAAIGRYLVLRPLGGGTTGPVFHATTPETDAPVAIKLFKVDLTPDAAHGLAQALSALIDQTPEHDALPRPVDTGLDETEAYFVTSLVDGDPLDAALKNYGPAAIEDLLPRLRTIADALDAAHHAGLAHGALHPRDVLVSGDATYVTGVGVAPLLARAGVAPPVRRPYGPPEAARGAGQTAEADQFALAAITFEWLFGRRILGPADRPMDLRPLPGVDTRALAAAFTTALSPDPDARFETCSAFSEAVAASLTPGAAASASAFDDEPEEALPLRPDPIAQVSLLDDDDVEPLQPAEPDPPAYRADAPRPPRPAERFGTGALVVTFIVGLVVGFAAGYMAIPRALQNPPMAASPPEAPADAAAPAAAEPPAAEPVAAPSAPIAASPAPAPPAPTGSLLVRSTPTGASVQVDGVPRGATPLALRDLELGARSVVVAQRGYVAREQRVVLTAGRPARTLDVRLTAESGPAPAAAAARPAPRAAPGSLVVESRPAGALVRVNNVPRGTTPVTIEGLAPGAYEVSMTLQGYRPFLTTVRVVAGERARAAASLSVQERE